jgi:hypothetical protein
MSRRQSDGFGRLGGVAIGFQTERHDIECFESAHRHAAAGSERDGRLEAHALDAVAAQSGDDARFGFRIVMAIDRAQVAHGRLPREGLTFIYLDLGRSDLGRRARAIGDHAGHVVSRRHIERPGRRRRLQAGACQESRRDRRAFRGHTPTGAPPEDALGDAAHWRDANVLERQNVGNRDELAGIDGLQPMCHTPIRDLPCVKHLSAHGLSPIVDSDQLLAFRPLGEGNTGAYE